MSVVVNDIVYTTVHLLLLVHTNELKVWAAIGMVVGAAVEAVAD